MPFGRCNPRFRIHRFQAFLSISIRGIRLADDQVSLPETGHGPVDRSLTFTMSRIFPLLHEARDLLTRLALPWPQRQVNPVRSAPRACKYSAW